MNDRSIAIEEARRAEAEASTARWNAEAAARRAQDSRQEMVTVVVSRGVYVLAVLAVLGLLAGGLYGCPRYMVYERELAGRAALVEAENSKKVQIEEAKANLEAERLNAEAEVVRAQGVSDAIDIEGGKITDTYIRYLWVKNLSFADTDIIYLPTESGMPLLNQPVGGSR